MNRTKGILAAGTLTGLVLITLLALGFGNLGATADNATAVSQQPQIVTTDTAAQDAVQAWQDYSAGLEQTVRTLQERESAYQSQIDSANQTIVNLQGQVNSAGSNPVRISGGEHEGFEHDD